MTAYGYCCATAYAATKFGNDNTFALLTSYTNAARKLQFLHFLDNVIPTKWIGSIKSSREHVYTPGADYIDILQHSGCPGAAEERVDFTPIIALLKLHGMDWALDPNESVTGVGVRVVTSEDPPCLAPPLPNPRVKLRVGNRDISRARMNAEEKEADLRNHLLECGMLFCETCKRFYRSWEGREHVCHMGRAKPTLVSAPCIDGVLYLLLMIRSTVDANLTGRCNAHHGFCRRSPFGLALLLQRASASS